MAKLNADEGIVHEVASLHDGLTFDKDMKLVLLLSYSTDELIKITVMCPEVLFMDCTARANIQRGEIFIYICYKNS